MIAKYAIESRELLRVLEWLKCKLPLFAILKEFKQR